MSHNYNKVLGLLLAFACSIFSKYEYAMAVTQQDINNIIIQQNNINTIRSMNVEDKLNMQRSPGNFEQKILIEQSNSLNNDGCGVVNNVELSDYELIDKKTKDKLLRDFYGKCQDAKQLDNLNATLNNYITKQGFVTSRVYLAPDSLKGDRLELEVIAGKINNINIIEDKYPKIRHNNAMPYSVKSGNILNTNDLEQGLAQINRLSSFNATLSIDKSEKSGFSDVNITTHKEKPFEFTASLDNSGQETTGKEQAEFGATFDDVLGLYDKWYFNYNNDAKQNTQGLYSKGFIGNVSIPYGNYLFSFSSSYFEYLSNLQGSFTTFSSSGSSYSHNLAMERLVLRSSNSETKAKIGLTAKHSRNYIENILTTGSSFKLAILNIGLSDTRAVAGGILNSEITYKHGLKILGVADDLNVSSSRPRSQFEAITATIAYQKPFTIASQNLAFNSLVNINYSPDSLFSTERISIGGLNTVRGFRDGSIGGDNGWYIRNELKYYLPKLLPGILGENSLYTYASYDIGKIIQDSYDSLEGGTLSGTSLGIGFDCNNMNFKIAAERAISKPDFIEDEGLIIYSSVGVRW